MRIMNINFRENQNYWINPNNKVQRISGGIVCDVLPEKKYDSNFVYDVCHAKTDDEVIKLCTKDK